jgi:putative membrane protein
MRFVCLLILVAIGGAVIAFAVQNQHDVTLTFFNYNLTLSVPILVGAVYLLGMVSGWSVVGLLRRSFVRVVEFPEARRQRAAW